MENQTVILEKMITSLLNEKKYPSLRDILVTMNPSDIASVFDGLEPGPHSAAVSSPAQGAGGRNLRGNGAGRPGAADSGFL